MSLLGGMLPNPNHSRMLVATSDSPNTTQVLSVSGLSLVTFIGVCLALLQSQPREWM